MTKAGLLSKVQEHPTLEVVSMNPPIRDLPKCCLLFRNLAAGSLISLPVSEVKKHDWPRLGAILTGREPTNNMRHMSRIVGYFSSHTNWNRSKLAEATNRRAGDYEVR